MSLYNETAIQGSAPVSDNLSITQIASMLKTLWAKPNCPPILLIGPPGGGKTSIINQVAAELGMPCETLMGNTLEPSDVAGIPHLVNDEMRLAPPAWALRIKDRAAVLNFDELNTARPATLAALLRVILERKVGDINLGPNVFVVATMNPAEEAAHGWELPPAVSNRFLHLSVAPTSVQEWQAWANRLDESPEFHRMVNDFPLPTLYGKPDSGPFASPRAWYFALKAAACLIDSGQPARVHTVVSAAVGVGTALSWEDAQRKIDPRNTDWSQIDPGKLKLTIDQYVEQIKNEATNRPGLVDDFWHMILAATPHHAAMLYVTLGNYRQVLTKHTTPVGMEALRKIQELVK